MKKYEFFCVCAQELADEEISSLIGTITGALSQAGATNIQERVLGKQRLAYPFPGRQAYGTFVLIVFDAEPDAIELFKEKIRFEKGISRSVVRVYAEDASARDKTQEDVRFVPSASEQVSDEASSEVVEPEVEVRKASTEEAPPVTQTSPDSDSSTLSQDELDKRIDALLNEDIDPEKL